MAITSYSTLQAAVAGWLGRTDLVAVVPDFIALAEAQIARRLRRTTKTASITVSSETTSLPADCAELRSIRLVTGVPGWDGALEVVTPEMLFETRMASSAAGRPVVASLVGNVLRVAPAPSAPMAVELTYFVKLTPLSDSNPTTALLTEAPDLYLFGALKEAEPYLEHDDRVPLWSAKFDAAIGELETARAGEEFNASLRPARLPVRLG